MPDDVLEVAKPQRWAVPFSETITEVEVDRILELPLFAKMNPAKFPKSVPLSGIIRNDCALRSYEDRQLIIRQGDYGTTAYLIISGEAKVFLDGDLPESALGHTVESPKNLLRQVWNAFVPPKDEAPKHLVAVTGDQDIGSDASVVVFFQDIPATTRKGSPPPVLKAGQIFGELSALGRTPRSATVIASGPCEILEIRWQGLRDLRANDPAFKTYIDRLYREMNLKNDHFSTMPLFAGISPESLEALRNAAVFESFGSFEWSAGFKKSRQSGTANAAAEPVICAENGVADQLYLIRAGFARVSHQVGATEITTRYLNRGEMFGLEALRTRLAGLPQTTYDSSLRALGYVDVIRIPFAVVVKALAGNEGAQAWLDRVTAPIIENRDSAHLRPLTGELMEFGTEARIINGSSIMTIDLERCTRCDDCVRGCSSAHGGTPRFIRHGEVSHGFLFPNACMHCHDPVCMIGCPTGAISRTKDGGQVIINDQTCIGCSTCANSCPYDNIRMVDRTHHGVPLVDKKGGELKQATKCDLCYDQVGGPTCVRSCPHDALERVDFAGALSLLGRREG